MPYYLSHLDISGIDTTLTYLKKNINRINDLHYSLGEQHNKFDTTDLNICLVRLKILNDTLIINELYEAFNDGYKKDYRQLIVHLSRIRTSYSFQQIGNLFLSDLKGVPESRKQYIKEMALASFLAYVKNFPDRSTKWQDTFNLWNMVQYSSVHGKDYAAVEYMEMAKKWYVSNKNNLQLDYDKY